MDDKHIVIIGFKNTGKTVVGKNLSIELNMPFIDLDEELELEHLLKRGKNKTCREIVKEEGLRAFREMETLVLSRILKHKRSTIISLGGGTPLSEKNQKLIRSNIVVHISSHKALIFERIMMNGCPAFFEEERDPFSNFQKAWNIRNPIYKNLAHITAKNDSDIKSIVKKVKVKLKINS